MLRATTFRKIPEQICNVEVVLKDGTYKTNALVLREVRWFRKQLLDMEMDEWRQVFLPEYTLEAFEEYHKFLQSRKVPEGRKRAIVTNLHEVLSGKTKERRAKRVAGDDAHESLFEMEL